MHLQTLRPRVSSFDKFIPPVKKSSETYAVQPVQQPKPAYTEEDLPWYECATFGNVKDALARGVAPSQILYTNVQAAPAHLRLAARLGVETVAVDSTEDILQVKSHHPRAKLVFRVNAGEGAPSTISFRNAMEMVNDLLEEANAYKLRVVGVNFYVSSLDLFAHSNAFESSPQLLKMVLLIEQKLAALGIMADLISNTGSSSGRVKRLG